MSHLTKKISQTTAFNYSVEAESLFIWNLKLLKKIVTSHVKV